MERERDISRHEVIVQPFIKDAFKEGAHRIKPKYTKRDQWFRQIMIGVVYNDTGSSATAEELADKYGAFKQSIACSNKSFLENLWNNSSPELQDRYHLNEILTVRKPRSQRSRERQSESLGGAGLRIKKELGESITDIDTISRNTGIPVGRISNFRGRLREWGVNVPRKLASYKEALKQLEEETDDKKTQELLNRISLHVVLHDLKTKRESSQFSSLSPLIREAGFRSYGNDVHLFEASLKSAVVPVPITRKEMVVRSAKHGTKTYYILLSRHKDRAIQALKDDQSLQRFQRKSS